MSITLKELREKTTEELIGALVMSSDSTTKSSKEQEKKIFKVLEERKVIDYEKMVKEYERIGMF